MRVRSRGASAVTGRLAAWVAVTYLGFALAGGNHLQALQSTTSLGLADILPGAALGGFVFGAVAGAIVGALQRVVLRSWAPGVRWWIPLTALAFGLVHAFNDAFQFRPLDLPVVLVADGLVLGSLQWVALRGALQRSWVWVPAVTIAWLVGSLLAVALLEQVLGDPLAELFVGWASAGLVMGLVTGAVLLQLLGREKAATLATP
jgi:hypothetical protein